MKNLIVPLVLLTFLGCVNVSETEVELKNRISQLENELRNGSKVENDKFGNELLSAVTGVWSNSNTLNAKLDGIRVFEINFGSDSLKTLKYLHTPSDNGEYVDHLYDVSIKNINKEHKTVSFYLTKEGEDFREPMSENIVWSLKIIKKPFSKEFNLELVMERGELYELAWVREY